MSTSSVLINQPIVPGFETRVFQPTLQLATSALVIRGNTLPAPTSASVATILPANSLLCPIVIAGTAGPAAGIYGLPSPAQIVQLLGSYVQPGDFLRFAVTNLTAATVVISAVGLNATTGVGLNSSFTIPAATSTGTAPAINTVGSTINFALLINNVTPGSESYSLSQQRTST